ncbi:MAG: hypothetical protein GC152_07515 [Alphaproteobacteria bacterium]|nr:hypothetical protein [Alphaproteobacteria bacterium]
MGFRELRRFCRNNKRLWVDFCSISFFCGLELRVAQTEPMEVGAPRNTQARQTIVGIFNHGALNLPIWPEDGIRSANEPEALAMSQPEGRRGKDAAIDTSPDPR